jgi:hypothetical protein
VSLERGSIAFGLIFLLLFVSRQKESHSGSGWSDLSAVFILSINYNTTPIPFSHKATKTLPLPFIKLNDIGRSTTSKKGI